MSENTIKRETSINVSKKSVTVTRSTKRGNLAHRCKWELDFSKVTPEQMYELATRSVVIDYQRTFRELSDVDAKKMEVGKLDVSELFIAKERKSLTPQEQIKRAAGKLTAGEKAELLKELGIVK